MQARQEVRVVLAQAQAQRLYAGDFAERDPGEVLMATVADIDSVVQRLKGQIDGQPFLTAHDLVLLRDWLELAAKWSSVVLNGRLEERKVRISRETGRQFHDLLQAALSRILGEMVELGLPADLKHRWPELTRRILLEELRAAQGWS